MDALYPYVKTLHILFAIIAVGFNASYVVWLLRGQRDPQHLVFAVRGVKFMDDYVANPCYVLLLLSGVAMAFFVGHWGFQRWIVVALVLWAILMGLGYRVYTPTLSAQIRTLAAEGPESPAYKVLDRRQNVVGIALVVLVVAIIVLMVFKP